MAERLTADLVAPLGADDERDDGEVEEAHDPPVSIANAGLVVLGVWLPWFFELLGYVTGDDEAGYRITDPAMAPRMVHLLQWCVDERAGAPAAELVLNEVLCGVPAGTPVEPIEPTDDELDVCEELLAAVLSQWDAIEGTSFDGLRETFLLRDGRLERRPDGWHLEVQRKAVDKLVDQLPWSVSVVYHRWMDAPLLVQWTTSGD